MKTKTIEGDLVLKKDFKFDGNLIIRGSIRCKNGIWSIVAVNIDAVNINAGNIDAWDIVAVNIDAGNIDAVNIDAWDIDAVNIDAGNIDAVNIDAWDIVANNISSQRGVFCASLKLRAKGKLKAQTFIKNKFNYPQKEFKV